MSALVFASRIGSCLACGSAVYNLTVDGERMQVDYGRGIQPRAGVIALNPRTRGARQVTEQDMPAIASWVRGGVTFHQIHADHCVRRPKHTPEDSHAGHA